MEIKSEYVDVGDERFSYTQHEIKVNWKDATPFVNLLRSVHINLLNSLKSKRAEANLLNEKEYLHNQAVLKMQEKWYDEMGAR